MSSRLRFMTQVASVVILASASAACSNATRLGLPLFTGATGASANAGEAQAMPPSAVGGQGAPVATGGQVARTELPPLPAYTGPSGATPTYQTAAAPAYATPAPAPEPEPTYQAAAPAPSPTPAAASGGTTVTLLAGETLYSLSRRHNVSVEAIMRANGIADASRVRSGMQITIPGATSSGAAPTQVAAAGPMTLGAPPANLGTIPVPAGTPGAVPTARPTAATAPSPAPVPTPTPTVAATPIAPAAAPAPAPTQVAAVTPTEPPSVSGTEFRWPVRGRIISSFGVKPDGERNDGINLAVPEGTQVKAAEAGTVIYAGNEIAGFGNLILVRHSGGWVSAYAHTKDIMVQRGATVSRGQTIATAGATGSVTSPQLHFELRQGSTPVNPLDHLTGA